MRTLLCTLLALAVAFGSLGAADEAKKKKKKAAAGVSGEIVKINADAGTITVKVALKKKSTEEKEYKITDKTTVTELKGNDKLEVKADKVADLLKKEQFKEGATVSVETDEDGKTAKTVTFGSAAKKKKKKDTQ